MCVIEYEHGSGGDGGRGGMSGGGRSVERHDLTLHDAMKEEESGGVSGHSSLVVLVTCSVVRWVDRRGGQ
jgi:hypothetical protein